jgi:hypothetical protein
VRHTSHARLLLIFAVSLAVIIAVVFGLRALVVKPVPAPHCPQDCIAPPIGPPGGVLPVSDRDRRCPPVCRIRRAVPPRIP